MKRNVFRAVASLAIIYFYCGCTKQDSGTVDTASSFSNSLTQNGKVLTPFGPMDKQHVHFIDDGYYLSIESNHIKKIEEKTDKAVQDFGEAGYNDELSGVASKSAANLPSGWITYAYWFNDTSKPVTYFSTNWKVPSGPTTNHGQTLFLFNGMQDGFSSTSHILQPVLQWGYSAAGGGYYWAITNWYVSGNEAFYGALENVSTGTNLQGVMESIKNKTGGYSYTSYFDGYPKASSLKVKNVPQLYWAAETLETYNCEKNSDYPPDAKVALNSIQILRGNKNASLNWTPVNSSGIAQHTTIVSNASPGGEVDIYFHK